MSNDVCRLHLEVLREAWVLMQNSMCAKLRQGHGHGLICTLAMAQPRAMTAPLRLATSNPSHSAHHSACLSVSHNLSQASRPHWFPAQLEDGKALSSACPIQYPWLPQNSLACPTLSIFIILYHHVFSPSRLQF